MYSGRISDKQLERDDGSLDDDAPCCRPHGAWNGGTERNGTEQNGEEKRDRTQREDCEASRRWSALDLASVRSLAGPSCSPVLICFLLPSRRPSGVPSTVPSSAIPPQTKRGVWVAPGLSSAGCRRSRRRRETPAAERRRMRTPLITLVVLYAPEEPHVSPPPSHERTDVARRRCGR